MAIGDVRAVDVGDVSGIHYVDTGMFDVAGYGSVYVIDADRPALVDTGIGTHYERVLDALDAVGIDPDDLAVIAPTHVHLDHAGGAGFLARECPNATVAVHRIGAPHLADPGRLVEGTKRAVCDQWEYYVEPEPVPEDRIRELEDGDRIDLGDRVLEVRHAPGHAPHQVIYHAPEDGVVFTADAAGVYVPDGDRVRPTSPPPNFDLEACLDDVETIRGLAPDVLCYGHFGPAPTGDRLDRYEDVLEDWIATVAALRDEGLDAAAIVDRVVETESGTAWNDRKLRGETAVNVRGALRYLEGR